MTKSVWAALFVFAASVGLAPAAYADSQYKFDVVFNDGGATETLNAQLIVSGDEIVGMTGTLDGKGFTDGNTSYNGFEDITALLGNTNFPSTDSIRISGGTDLIFDNLFDKSTASIDNNGIVFQLQNGVYVNVWENSHGNFEMFINYGVFDGTGAGAFASEVPEPSTLLMLFTGLMIFAGGLIYARRMRSGSASKFAIA